jgi:hypothetical protein
MKIWVCTIQFIFCSRYTEHTETKKNKYLDYHKYNSIAGYLQKHIDLFFYLQRLIISRILSSMYMKEKMIWN